MIRKYASTTISIIFQIVTYAPRLPTLTAVIFCIKIRLHATANVSIEFENVCVWYVQVTYEDATSKTAIL